MEEVLCSMEVEKSKKEFGKMAKELNYLPIFLNLIDESKVCN